MRLILAGPNTAIHPTHIVILEPLLNLLVDLAELASGRLVLDDEYARLCSQKDPASLGELQISDMLVQQFRVEDSCGEVEQNESVFAGDQHNQP